MTHWIYRTGQRPLDLDAVYCGDVRLRAQSREQTETLLREHEIPITAGSGLDSMIEEFARWQDQRIEEQKTALARKQKQDAADNETLASLIRALENTDNREQATALADILRTKSNGA